MKYNVAGHIIELVHDGGEELQRMLQNYEPFVYGGAEAPIMSVQVLREPAPQELLAQKKPIFLQASEDPLETRLDLYGVGEDFLLEMSPGSEIPVCAWLFVSHDYSSSKLYCTAGMKSLTFAVNNSMMILYAFRTAALDTLEIHASVIVNGGKGYLFLGKSGTGKSTHSRLWLEHIKGSSLLNDDNPVVRVAADGTARVYGSPWSGKTPCYINHNVPVGGFVQLFQAPHNSIEPLSIPEAYASLYSSSSGFKADAAMADGLHATLEKVVVSVPFYKLMCLPDEEAAQLCHNTLAPSEPMILPNDILLGEVSDLLSQGCEVEIMTKGSSMTPFIRGEKDSVVLEKKESVSRGDIVLAHLSDKRYVLHRVLRVEGDTVTLRGDGNLTVCETCTASDICGTVKEIKRPDGKSVRPGTARIWQTLPAIARRVYLGFYRRIVR